MKEKGECGKICYSQREAGQIINGMTGTHYNRGHRVKNQHYSQHKTPVRYYYCKECKSWHLTSKRR